MVRRLQAKTPLWISIKTPLLIIQILPKYHPNNIQKSSRNHPEIIQISPTYHPHIIQISPTYHPDITHISSRYHPHIIQISSKDHPVNIDFYLVKSRVFTQIWYVVCRWKLHFQTRLKLHFWKAKVEFYSSFTRVSVCWDGTPQYPLKLLSAPSTQLFIFFNIPGIVFKGYFKENLLKIYIYLPHLNFLSS